MTLLSLEVVNKLYLFSLSLLLKATELSLSSWPFNLIIEFKNLVGEESLSQIGRIKGIFENLSEQINEYLEDYQKESKKQEKEQEKLRKKELKKQKKNLD